LRVNCERSESDESAKLGIFGASSFDAAIDAAVMAANLMTDASVIAFAAVTKDVISAGIACGILDFPSGLDV
jgi:hypothetical protein